MRRHHLSLTVAVCVSLCVHAWAIHALIGRENEDGGLNQMSMARVKGSPARRLAAVEVVPLPKREALPMEFEQQFGRNDGRGDAINSMSGDRPLRAKQAPLEQAILTRQPGEHREGQVVKPKVTNPRGEAASGGKNGVAEKMLAALEPRTLIVNNQAAVQQMVGLTVRPQTSPQLKQPAQKAMTLAGSGGAAVAGWAGKSAPTPAGDPGQKSESESDAFSNVGAAVFQEGRLEARFGRKVITVRPNFTIGGRMELANMLDPSVQLEVHADSDGKPTRVEILQSSGSTEVDEPVKLALYRWWFEPPKDRHGKPMADVMVWTISFR